MKAKRSVVRMHKCGEEYQEVRLRAMSGLRNKKFTE